MKEAQEQCQIKRKDYLVLDISGIVGNVLPYFLYPIAQTKIDSATSGVLTSLTPFFALIVGVIFYQLKASKNNIIGLVVGFVGTSILIVFSNNSDGVNVYGSISMTETSTYGWVKSFSGKGLYLLLK